VDFEGLLIALHTQESNFSGGNEPGHAVKHSQTSAENRYNERLRVSYLYANSVGDRSGDGVLYGANLAGRLVREQGDEFVDQLTEGRRRSVLVTKDCEFVGHKRVIGYVNAHTSNLPAMRRSTAVFG
jgi:hypothetical protein